MSRVLVGTRPARTVVPALITPLIRALATTLATALVVGLAGCAGGSDGDTAAPAGVTAHVLQWRSDQTVHRMQLSVVNGGKQKLTVSEARLVSPRYQGEPTWRQKNAADAAVFAPGQGFDLPAILTEPNCPAKDASAGDVAAPVIRLRVQQADGGSHWVRVTATDPDDALPRVQKIDCVRVGTLAVTAVDVAPPVIGGRGRPGTIAVKLTPTGKPGTVTFESVGTTTLLVPAEGASWDVHRQVSARTGPVTLQLKVMPNRCDPHAVAEDKVGTLLPFTVSVDGGPPGILTIPPPLEVRTGIYTFITRTCGFPTS